MDEAGYQKIVATIILVLLGVLLLFAIFPYRNAFFGAFILYVLFHPLYQWLIKKKKWSKQKSTWTVIILTLVIILIPLSAVVPLAISQVSDIVSNQNMFLAEIETLDAKIPQYDLTKTIRTVVTEGAKYFQTQLGSLIGGATEFFIIFIIMYFVLYYLFIHSKKVSKIKNLLPFSKRHTKILINEFTQVSKATIFSTGLIALIQGGVLGIGLAIAGVPGALFLTFAAIILSFIPILGIPIIWIPASGFLFLAENWIGGIFILVLGIVLSNVDNFLRPVLQSKIGKIHPLVSLLGVFIGLPLFGIIGIVIGPLVISYFFLILDMYIKEYVKVDDETSDQQTLSTILKTETKKTVSKPVLKNESKKEEKK